MFRLNSLPIHKGIGYLHIYYPPFPSPHKFVSEMQKFRVLTCTEASILASRKNSVMISLSACPLPKNQVQKRHQNNETKTLFSTQHIVKSIHQYRWAQQHKVGTSIIVIYVSTLKMYMYMYMCIRATQSMTVIKPDSMSILAELMEMFIGKRGNCRLKGPQTHSTQKRSYGE